MAGSGGPGASRLEVLEVLEVLEEHADGKEDECRQKGEKE